MKEEKKILIIDNDQEVIDSIVVSLFYINYKVDYSSDVDESLKLFWENLYWIVIINLYSNIKNIDKNNTLLSHIRFNFSSLNW